MAVSNSGYSLSDTSAELRVYREIVKIALQQYIKIIKTIVRLISGKITKRHTTRI